MPNVASIVPDDADLLCEGCGYTLNGLPAGGNCPECGKPIAESVGNHRELSAFERHPGFSTLLQTTSRLLLRTSEFYRTVTTRAGAPAAGQFAAVHLGLAVILFSSAALGHFLWILESAVVPWSALVVSLFILTAPPVIAVFLVGLIKLAVWLSAVEARYWGMRLPYPVVNRALLFHSASYLPVGIVANLIIWGYRLLLATGAIDARFDTFYLYTLCAFVILAAVYLFQMYWIAMKRMMYANR